MAPFARAALLGAQLLAASAKPPSPAAAPRSELRHECSRPISRLVRKSLEKEVLKPASRAGLGVWPEGCPFDPDKDLYGRHERHKQRKKPGSPGVGWNCGFCGKSFKNEHYLDLHMERRHMNETPGEHVHEHHHGHHHGHHDDHPGAYCLADYCEMFELCQGEVRYNRQKEKPECNNETIAQSKKRCENAMRLCFPLGQEISRKLHAQMSRHWCQVLDCRIREEKRREHEAALIPVAVLLILLVLAGFIVFSIVVCCVDYSDDIIQFLVESGVASNGCIRKLLKAREKTRESVGMDRVKGI